MAMLLEPYLDNKLDIVKLLKMIIIHDLVEAEAKDIPAFETLYNKEKMQEKKLKEKKLLKKLKIP